MQTGLIAPGFALLGLIGCAAAPGGPIPEGAPRRALVAYLGERSLDELDGTDLEDQPTFGAALEWASTLGPFLWEVGFLASEEDDDVLGFDVEASTRELFAGARYPFGDADSTVRPYVGGGLAWIDGEVDLGPMADDDRSPGLYVHVGADWRISDTLFLGIDYRILRGTDLEILGADADADYDQIALRFGTSF